MDEDVFQRLFAPLRRLDEDNKIFLDLLLTDVFGEPFWPQRNIEDEVLVTGNFGDDSVRHRVNDNTLKTFYQSQCDFVESAVASF